MINKLVSKIKKMGAPVVVGLDPMLNYVPEFVQKKAFEENSFAEAMVNAVTVWKIVTENVTGKRHE